MIVAIAADHTREVNFLPAIKRRLEAVPAGLAAALVLFIAGYWGLHAAFYGVEGRIGPPTDEMATHTRNPEQPHGPEVTGSIAAPPDRSLTPSPNAR